MVSRRLIEVDPFTKTATYHHYDHATDTTRIEQVQDVAQVLRRTKMLRNDPSYKARGIKDDYYHFASVPNSVLVELLDKYHLDWQNKDDLKKIEQVIARDYKYLLTVDKI